MKHYYYFVLSSLLSLASYAAEEVVFHQITCPTPHKSRGVHDSIVGRFVADIERHKRQESLSKLQDVHIYNLMRFEQTQIRTFNFSGERSHFWDGYYERIKLYNPFNQEIQPTSFYSLVFVINTPHRMLDQDQHGRFFPSYEKKHVGNAYKLQDGAYWMWFDTPPSQLKN